MEFRVLQYFLAVTREGNISAAAQSLHLSQPSLSRQLRDLEEELGVTLFIRGKRRIELTEEGLILRKRASEMMQLVELTESEIFEVGNHIAGSLNIGAGESRSMRKITAIFKELKDDYPFTDFDKEMYHHLTLNSKEIFGVIMPKSCELAKKESVTVRDLYDKPLIVSRANSLKIFSGSQVRHLRLAATYNLLYNASLMVEDGIGYAISFDKLVDTSESSPLCFRPLSPELSVRPTLIWKRDQKLSPVSQLFIDRLSGID